MSDAPTQSAALAISADRSDSAPLSVQVYEQIRDLILGGRLAPGQRLPSTRGLAQEIGVSRTTTLAAYDQLAAEGFVDGHRGAGVFVAELPPELLRLSKGRGGRHRDDGTIGGSIPDHREPRSLVGQPFDPGAPDTAAFPAASWARSLGRSWRQPSADLFYGEPTGGFPPLRRAIAAHLKAMRGLDCNWEQVIIVSGAREAIDLVVRALLSPGQAAWIEEPGYPTTRNALRAAGLHPVPVPVDGEGLDVAAGCAKAPEAGLAVVTPSRQYPLGATMALSRRLALLDWAGDGRAWIVEDDYDSEYRYAGRPIAALAELDADGRVIYVGSFSKVMFRSLRLSYLVAPAAVLPTLLTAQRTTGSSASMVAQPPLAEFIDSGDFAIHIRRMRRLYAERQRGLLQAIRHKAGDLLAVAPQDAGMHVVARLCGSLARGTSDVEAAARCAKAGLNAPALSSFYVDPPSQSGLLLGFAGWPTIELEAAVNALAATLCKP